MATTMTTTAVVTETDEQQTKTFRHKNWGIYERYRGGGGINSAQEFINLESLQEEEQKVEEEAEVARGG